MSENRLWVQPVKVVKSSKDYNKVREGAWSVQLRVRTGGESVHACQRDYHSYQISSGLAGLTPASAEAGSSLLASAQTGGSGVSRGT